MSNEQTTLNLDNVDLSGFSSLDQPMSAEDVLREQKKTQLNATMSQAIQTNPQQQAKLNNLSRQSGIPVPAVESDVNSVESHLKLKNIDLTSLVNDNPVTAGYLSDYNNAAIAHNDIDTLKGIESIMNPKDPKVELPFNTLRGVGGRISALMGGLVDFVDESSKALDEVMPSGMFTMVGGMPLYLNPEQTAIIEKAQGGTKLKGFAEELKAQDFGYIPASTWESTKDAFTNDGVISGIGEALSFGVESTIVSTPDMAAAAFALPAYILARSNEMGDERAKNKGLKEATIKETFEAMPFAIGSSLLEAILPTKIFKGMSKTEIEKVGQEILEGVTSKVKEVLTRSAEGMIIESSTEAVQEGIIEYIGERYGTDAPILAREMLDRGLGGFVGGGIGGSVLAGGVEAINVNRKAIEETYHRWMTRKADAQSKEQMRLQMLSIKEQRDIDGINAYATNSELRELDPEAFRQFIDQSDGDKDLQVFIDGVQTRLYLSENQDMSDPVIAMLSEKANEAAALGTDVAIPIADFATIMAGTPHFDALRDSMTMNGDTTAPFRQEQSQEQSNEYIRSLMDEAQENVSEYVEAQEIFNSVREQLIDTGRVGAADATVMAQLVPAWATVFAKRNGLTIKQAYEQSGLIIEGPQTGEAARLAEEAVQLNQVAEGEATGQEFAEALAAARELNPNAPSVAQYDASEYDSMSNFLLDDGKAGYAIEDDGNLVGVFKSPESTLKGAIDIIVPQAIANGATKLNAFDGFLVEQYKKHGFVEVARDPWNEQYRPDGWTDEMGTPDVVYMELQNEQDTGADARSIQDQSRVRGSEADLQQRAGEGRRELSPLQDAPSVEGVNGPIEGLVRVAEQYAIDNGIDLKRQGEYVEVDPERATRIAEAYEQMENAPNDPVVREAYENLIEQTKAQYQALVDAGYQFWFVDLSRDDNLEYISSPWNSMRDIAQNKQMGVFPTDEGFGTDEAFDPSKNPLLADTGIKWPSGGPDGEMKTVYANDLFRAVHDAFGHGLEGAGFRARGEENAWQAHVRLFTGSAVGAITSETRGQNSWVNYGPSGEQNRTASAEDTVFADQKVGLMPEWTWTEGRASDEAEAEVFRQAIDQTETEEFKNWSDNGEVVESHDINDYDFKADTPVVLKVFHGTTHRFSEFDASEGNKEGQFGAVNYFTSSEMDASENYAGEGPDLTNRIEQRSERLEDELGDLDSDEIQELAEEYGLEFNPETETYPEGLPAAIARRELSGGDEILMELFVRLDNPFVIGGDSNQWVQLREEITDEELYQQAADDTGEDVADIEANPDDYEDAIDDARWSIEEDRESPLAEAIDTIARKYDLSTADILADFDDIMTEESVSSTDLEQMLRHSEQLSYSEDPETGEMISSQVIGEVIRELGYDSIVLKNANDRFKNMTMESGTAHVHIFDSNNTNIKSVDNTGTFDPTNPDIYAQTQLNDIGMYSAVEKSLLNMNIQGWSKKSKTRKASGKEIWQKLKKENGVKVEELEWLGIEDFLLAATDKLSRDEVVKFVQSNGVNVREIVASDATSDGDSDVERLKFTDNGMGTFYSNVIGRDEFTIKGGDDTGYDIFINDYKMNDEDIWSLNEAKVQAEEIFASSDMVLQEPNQSYIQSNGGTPRWEEYVAGGDYSNYRELKLQLPDVAGEYSNQTHFEDTNLVAWLRITDRDLPSGNTYFIDEFQSDWHQDGRQLGYSSGNADALFREADDIATEFRKEHYVLVYNHFARMMEEDPARGVQLTEFTDMGDGAGGLDLDLLDIAIGYSVRLPGAEFDRIYVPRLLKLKGSEYSTPEVDSHIDSVIAKHKEYMAAHNASEAARRGVPDAPFKGNSWLNLGLKRAIIDAVEQGKDSIAWVDSNELVSRWSEQHRNLYEMQYDTKMPSMVKKLTGQTPVHLNSEGGSHTGREDGYWVVQLTPELKERVKRDAFPLFQNQGVTKGYYSPSESAIRLTEASDLSTFLHEFAHFMYEMELTNTSNSPDALNTISSIHNWYKRNAEDVAKEAGDYAPNTTIIPRHVIAYLDNGTAGDTERDEAIRRAVHEQFARGFETYLMEGKAPSIELRNVFRTFARWLTQIYRSLAGIQKVKLDDEMRQVFDRLLATEEQINAAEARAQYAPMFTDAAMAGMTEEEFIKYKKRQEKVKDKQTETLRDKLIKQLTRQTEAWWKDELADEVEVQTEALKTEKVYRAREALKNGDIKLDHATTKELIGENVEDKRGRKSRRIPPKLNGMTAKGALGVHPDEAAALLGYGSGDQMLKDLVDAVPIAEKAEAQAEAAMIQRHGDMMHDGTIEQLADEALLNEERGALILQELKALSKGTKAPAIDRMQLKAMAENSIGNLAYKDIHPAKYRKAELRAAQEAAVALEAGDKEAAVRAKTRQAMNFYLNKAATEARNDTMKIVERMARYNKKTVKEAIMRAENGYWEQIVKILGRFEFRKSATVKGVDLRNQDINSWMQERVETDGDALMLTPEILDEMYITHWKNVPYEKLKGINDSVKNLEHVARYANKIKTMGEEIEFKKLVSRWVSHMDKSTKSRFKSQRTDVAEGKNWGRWAMAQMTKIPFLASWLDGGERGGMSFDILVQPFTDAQAEEVKLWKEVGQPVMDLIEGRSKADIKRHNTKVFIPELVDENNDGNLYGNQIVAVALNVGNAGNLRKMLLGEGWANADDESEINIDNPKLQAVLKRMTKADWDLVQTIWDRMELLYPQLAEVHRRTTGLTPPKVEAVPVQTPFGEYKGGYYPVKYDPNRSQRAQENEDKMNAQVDSMFSGGASIQASVTASATNERTKYFAPIRLHLDVVPSHFQESIHFITHHDAVRQVNKLIRNPEVANMIKEKLGPEEYAQLKPWLNDIAKDGREAATKFWWEDMIGRLRFGITLGSMGFKASTGIMQFLGLSNIVAEVGAKHTYQAFREILGSPATIKGAWDFASSNSKILSNRVNSMDREIKNAMSRINSQINIKSGSKVKDIFYRFDNSNMLKTVQEASMKHIAYIQTYMVDLPTWYAAYIKEMELSGDEAKAYKVADFTVENLQGSGSTKDMAAIMRTRNETTRMLTMFMTFFSALWNLNRDVVKGAASKVYSPTSVAAKLMFLITVPVALEMLMRGELGDEDDDEELQKFLTKTALYPVASVPFVRDIASGTIGEFGYNISPVASLIEQGTNSIPELIRRPFTDEEITKGQVKGASKFIAAGAGLPATGQAWATGEHLYEVLEEGEDFTVRELLFGPKKEK